MLVSPAAKTKIISLSASYRPMAGRTKETTRWSDKAETSRWSDKAAGRSQTREEDTTQRDQSGSHAHHCDRCCAGFHNASALFQTRSCRHVVCKNCILSGTCAVCGTPWERLSRQRERNDWNSSSRTYSDAASGDNNSTRGSVASQVSSTRNDGDSMKDRCRDADRRRRQTSGSTPTKVQPSHSRLQDSSASSVPTSSVRKKMYTCRNRGCKESFDSLGDVRHHQEATCCLRSNAVHKASSASETNNPEVKREIHGWEEVAYPAGFSVVESNNKLETIDRKTLKNAMNGLKLIAGPNNTPYFLVPMDTWLQVLMFCGQHASGMAESTVTKAPPAPVHPSQQHINTSAPLHPQQLNTSVSPENFPPTFPKQVGVSSTVSSCTTSSTEPSTEKSVRDSATIGQRMDETIVNGEKENETNTKQPEEAICPSSPPDVDYSALFAMQHS